MMEMAGPPPPPMMEIKLIFFLPPKNAEKRENARNLVIFGSTGKGMYTILLGMSRYGLPQATEAILSNRRHHLIGLLHDCSDCSRLHRLLNGPIQSNQSNPKQSRLLSIAFHDCYASKQSRLRFDCFDW